MTNSNAFIFIYSDMNLGGIQKFIYNNLQNCINNNIDCYWIAPKNYSVDPGFLDVIKQTMIISIEKIDNFNFERYSHIVVVAFSFLQFEKIKIAFKGLMNVKFVYIIPHFQNPELYPENYFIRGKCQRKAYTIAHNYYQEYLDNNQVFFINRKHGEALQNRYGLKSFNIDTRVCKKIKPIRELNIDSINAKVQRKEFNIIAIARFEFPHKGFILGLISDFKNIKAKIPEATLTIIGYGEGEKDVNKLINSIPKDVSKDILLVGKVPYEGLAYYFDKANLNIGLAGTVADGASFGVPCLIARHYCLSLEVYGNYLDCYSMILAEEPGYSAIPFIEKIHELSPNEYIDMCIKTHELYRRQNTINYDPLWMFKIDTDENNLSHNLKDIRMIEKGERNWIFRRRIKLLLHNPKAFFSKVLRRLIK